MRWEYQTLKFDPNQFFSVNVDIDGLQQELNRLGQHSWELCNSFETNRGSGRTAEVVMIFKRPTGDIL